MENKHAAGHTFKVYQMIRCGNTLFVKKSFYASVFIISFNERPEAERWIAESGKKNVDYTIVEVFRNL